jgi:hypothetical protein
MKVLNLQCAHRHSFEGWFASEDDFQSQLARGLVECPMCTDKGIQKMPSAPRLNLGGHETASSASHHSSQQLSAPASTSALASQQNAVASGLDVATDGQAGTSLSEQAAFFKALRQVVANTEDVGDRFAHEARAMHYGDSEARSIRGRASPREAVELLHEGIDVLPLPAQLKETLQ